MQPGKITRISTLCMAAILCACNVPPAPRPLPAASAVSAPPLDLPDLTEMLPPLLTGRGTLPTRANSAEIHVQPHPSLAALPPAQVFVSVIYSQGAEFAGRTSIFLYAFPEELDAAWPLLLEQIITPQEITGPGELAAIDHSDIAFIRCSGLVHIKLVGADPDELQTFAETLDARLAPLLCQS